jgi:hypothetical protein
MPIVGSVYELARESGVDYKVLKAWLMIFNAIVECGWLPVLVEGEPERYELMQTSNFPFFCFWGDSSEANG